MFRALILTLALCASPSVAAVDPGVMEEDLTGERSAACGALLDIVGNVLYMRHNGLSEAVMRTVMLRQMTEVNPPDESGVLPRAAQAWLRDADTAIQVAKGTSREEAGSYAGVQQMVSAVLPESEILAVSGNSRHCAI